MRKHPPSTKAITFCSHHRAKKNLPKETSNQEFYFLIWKLCSWASCIFISHAFSFPYLPIWVICAPGWTFGYFLSLVDVADFIPGVPFKNRSCRQYCFITKIPRDFLWTTPCLKTSIFLFDNLSSYNIKTRNPDSIAQIIWIPLIKTSASILIIR